MARLSAELLAADSFASASRSASITLCTADSPSWDWPSDAVVAVDELEFLRLELLRLGRDDGEEDDGDGEELGRNGPAVADGSYTVGWRRTGMALASGSGV